MSKKVNIGSAEYTLNQSGDSAGWGESQSDLIEALVDAINGFFGPGDILPTSQAIGDNVTEVDTVDGIDIPKTPIPFFQFDGSVVRFFESEYTVIRQNITGANVVFEAGKIFGENDPNGTWSINQQRYGNNEAGVSFGINSNGKVTYISDKLAGGLVYDTANSKITFKVKAIIK